MRERTESGLIEPVYRPASLHGFDPASALGEPGTFPYTRGVHETGYRGWLWTMPQYAGFGTARESNHRYHQLLDASTTVLSVAFDLPTRAGAHDRRDRAGRARPDGQGRAAGRCRRGARGRFQRGEIERSAYEVSRGVESGERVVVGVNRFISDGDVPYLPGRLDPAQEAELVDRVRALRSARSAADVDVALDAVCEAAAGSRERAAADQTGAAGAGDVGGDSRPTSRRVGEVRGDLM